jgi:uncharacterized integral membrane protein
MNDKRNFKIYGAICWIVAIVWFIVMIMEDSVIFIAISAALAIFGYVLWTWEFPQKPNTQGVAT